jgi:hypothetical protein
VLRNPYIAGVERFEAPFSIDRQTSEPSQRLEQAAQFCLLLWEQFQSDLRAMRYTLNCDRQDDTTIEFAQQPPYAELIEFDLHDAQQIDIECISQQASATGKDLPAHSSPKDEHFPAFLEVFIPLSLQMPQPKTLSPEDASGGHLVIWCRPNLLPKVTSLWERAASLLANPS